MIRVGRVGRVRRVSGGTLTKSDLMLRDPTETRQKMGKCIIKPKDLVVEKRNILHGLLIYRIIMSLRGSSY